MSKVDTMLEKFGLKYDDLTQAEKDTFHGMLDALKSNEITVQKIKEYISTMRDSVETELISEPEFHYIFIFKIPNRKEILLKARLRNYMLLESFLTSPEKAKQAIDRALGNLKK